MMSSADYLLYDFSYTTMKYMLFEQGSAIICQLEPKLMGPNYLTICAFNTIENGWWAKVRIHQLWRVRVYTGSQMEAKCQSVINP